MTRSTNARIAGWTFLAYIAAGIASMFASSRAIGAGDVAARLERLAQHATDVRLLVLLGLLQSFSAVVLGVTLRAITRDEDEDLATFGLVCRVVEGVIGAASVPGILALHWLASARGADAPDAAAAQVLARYLLRNDVALTATFFAAGSTAFAYLLLRGRMIPAALAWIGVVASALLVVGLPLQLAGFLRGPVTMAMWLPMLAFEIPLAGWFIARGVAPPVRARAA
jgi:hypothetical protein